PAGPSTRASNWSPPTASSAGFRVRVLAPLGGARPLGFGRVIGRATAEGAACEAHIVFEEPTVRRCTRSSTRRSARTPGCPTSRGAWPEHHPSYCGQFVRDPNGHNQEAVCHRPG
ncbi:hypothetical protein, partial [Streptomyces sp. NPDC051098]|uniref:hypothetical protein n=1 Tax=Streptomyces sp. NPDC051098 TaxID=3155411 RepID=UPI0034281297